MALDQDKDLDILGECSTIFGNKCEKKKIKKKTKMNVLMNHYLLDLLTALATAKIVLVT